MNKKQVEAESLTLLSDILEYLELNKDVSLAQEPYKHDFFSIFSRAFRAGYCTVGRRLDRTAREYIACDFQRPIINGTAIREFLVGKQWIERGDESSNRYLMTEAIRKWWDEWTYAWENCPSRPPHRTLRQHSNLMRRK